MSKTSLISKVFRNCKSRTGRLFCSFFIFSAFLLAVYLPAGAQGVTPAAAAQSSVKIEDVDGDGLKDAFIETRLLRIILSSRTGSPSVYYLKGPSFEENLYPPILQDLGYKIASESLRPFISEIQGSPLPATGYTIDLEEQTAETIVVRATANVAIAMAEKSGAEEPGLSMVKRYTFSTDGYFFHVEHVISNLREQLASIGTDDKGALSMHFGPGLFLDPYGPMSLLGLKPGAVEVLTDVQGFSAKGAVAGAYNGVGLRDQYFCVIIDTEESARVSATAFEVPSEDQKKKTYKGYGIACTLPKFNLGAKESRSFKFRVYAGPIILDQLTRINRGQVSEYGFLSTILLRILQLFYGIFPNYGLAIILMTVLVRALLYPLTLKQTKSMAQMQKIQPRVQDLKDRYKDNPQKFNEEVLKLYQKNNVNPLGGCLPLLLQLPILIALYNTIRIAVELRKTSFLWIADLSKGDPLLILPIAIAGLMYYQQGKMTDPQQQQMMAFMPIFMFVITWSLPAGLLVYWFASSVLGLLQQLQANRIAAAIKEE
ncbi:MAG TPA: YidC/Oxa1 family insertase periplasmic-domain containing protein [Candidatus Rifleibacterium sp.]|mgnify:CR=1 FL=1|nr:YidC/Oxa1 family insertase periplasmic-domain containing protein [Candidatus Rifleibacterium sp.]HPT47899.1 YidC/Oxa1 family insertase periplasmic-domain containing protein [Candidatus Rifleibacterium sp.]